jgi:CheY-like chemotaxis protein
MHPMPNVLIAHDDVEFRKRARETLQQCGLQVLEADSPSTVLSQLEASQPLVVVLNASMMRDGRPLLDSIFTQQPLADKHAYILLTPQRNHPTRCQAVILGKGLGPYSMKRGETRLLPHMVNCAATLLPSMPGDYCQAG